MGLRPRPDGRSSDLLIADFGIGGIAARQALDAENRLSGLASMSILVGSHTPLYASPQHRQGADPDPRDDVHALGVIWYQLLIGDLTRGVPQGSRWKARLSEMGLSSGFIELLGDCIEERPADAAVLADRLTALLTPKPGEVITNSLGMKFAFVPCGSFLMGGEGGEPGDEEVTIERDFRLGVYPVTQRQWQAVMGTNPSYFSHSGRCARIPRQTERARGPERLDVSLVHQGFGFRLVMVKSGPEPAQ